MTYDLITVGNAVLDALLTLKENDPLCTLDQASKKLHIKMGEKLLVQTCFFSTGGGACRVAIGLSRLGFATTLYAQVGSDEFAQKILTTLKAENVDTQHIVKTNGQSSFTVGLNYHSERTLFTHYVLGEHNFSLSGQKTEWVYLGSLGEKWQQAYEHVANFVMENNVKLAVNPGPTQFQTGIHMLHPVFKVAHLLVVNRDEAQQIVGKNDDISGLLQSLQKLGPQIAVITDGANGSYAKDKDGKEYAMPIVKAHVIEKTGAGDAYVTGFLAASLKGFPVPVAMQWGTINAAAVISHPGTHEALLTVEKIEETLKENTTPTPKQIAG